MSCILCLEVTESYKDLIVFNSSLWQELNMQYIIEKHLWKLEVLNSQSYICQACWQELYNFHKFYLKLEKARSNLNNLLNTEEVTKEAVKTGNEKKTEKIFNIIAKVSLPEPETLFFKEECPLYIFEKEDDEIASSLKTKSNRKCSRKKSSQDKNVAKNSSRKKSSNDKINKLKSNENPDEIGTKSEVERIENDKSDEDGAEIDSELKTIENDAEVNKMEDEINSFCFKISNKLKSSRKESTNGNKIIARKSSRQRSNNDKSDTEIEEFQFVENSDEIDKELDENVDEIKRKLELEPTENDAKQKKVKENDQNHSSTKLDELSNVDKFVADNFQLNCDICKIPMDTFSAIVKHYREIHNQRGYVKCCGTKFITRVELIDHINIHENPEYLKCKYCTKTFAKRTCLKLHTKHVHEEKMVNCEICGKSLVTELCLKRHMLTHNTGGRRISCKQCGKSYLSKLALYKHMRVNHFTNIICHLCGKSIIIYDFRRHMAQHEGTPLPKVKCKMCDRQFADNRGLNRHVRSHHPPEGAVTEFKCDKCPKVFSADYNLKNHFRKVHTDTYARCTLCDKTFKGKKALEEHMARHRGEPLYVCGFCSRKFYSNGNYHTHRKMCSANQKKKCITKTTED